MKILLTGSEGFIGSHLRPRLEELGYEVIRLDLKRSAIEDIRVRLLIKCDLIIHLAALTGVRNSVNLPRHYFRTNVIATQNILDSARALGVKVLFASSSSVYGEQENPLREDMHCDKPLSPYAASKVAGEHLCRLSPAPVIAFRPFTVYGERGRYDMVISKIINAGINGTIFEKYGKGDTSRGYTHVDDLCDGIIKLIDYKPRNGFEVFNLGGNEEVKLNGLIKMAKEEFPDLKVKEVKRNKADVPHNLADISKAKKVLSWEPKRKFKEEFKKLCYLAKKQKK